MNWQQVFGALTAIHVVLMVSALVLWQLWELPWKGRDTAAWAVSPFVAIFLSALPVTLTTREWWARPGVSGRELVPWNIGLVIVAFLTFWVLFFVSARSGARRRKPNGDLSGLLIALMTAVSVSALLLGAAFAVGGAGMYGSPFADASPGARLRWLVIITLCPLCTTWALFLCARTSTWTGVALILCALLTAGLGLFDDFREAWEWIYVVFVWAPMVVLGCRLLTIARSGATQLSDRNLGIPGLDAAVRDSREVAMFNGPPESDVPPASQVSREQSEPRLGIVHFLVWTACVAAYLAAWQTMRGHFPAPPQRGALSGAIMALHAIVSGAGLAALLLWASRRRRGLCFPRHPGEYLLVLQGASDVVGVASPLCLDLSHFHHVLWGFLLLNAIPTGVDVAFRVWAALRARSARWRMFFLVSLLPPLIYLPAALVLLPDDRALRMAYTPMFNEIPVLQWATAVAALPTCALFILALFKDYRERQRYPWTHWLGIALCFWFFVLSLGSFLAYRLLR